MAVFDRRWSIAQHVISALGNADAQRDELVGRAASVGLREPARNAVSSTHTSSRNAARALVPPPALPRRAPRVGLRSPRPWMSFGLRARCTS
jgi:hypothetical protein